MTRISVYPCTDGAHPRPRGQPGSDRAARPSSRSDVAIEQGVDVLVVLSLIILALLGIGVIGALTSRASG